MLIFYLSRILSVLITLLLFTSPSFAQNCPPLLLELKVLKISSAQGDNINRFLLKYAAPFSRLKGTGTNMNNIDGNAPLSFKIIGQFLVHIFLIGFRRIVLFLVVAGTWGLLNATQVGFLQTIAPFVGIALGFVAYRVLLRKPKPLVSSAVKPESSESAV
jgi:hypothetical protein